MAVGVIGLLQVVEVFRQLFANHIIKVRVENDFRAKLGLTRRIQGHKVVQKIVEAVQVEIDAPHLARHQRQINAVLERQGVLFQIVNFLLIVVGDAFGKVVKALFYQVAAGIVEQT